MHVYEFDFKEIKIPEDEDDGVREKPTGEAAMEHRLYSIRVCLELGN